MNTLERMLPWLDLRTLKPEGLTRDALAAMVVAFTAVPQGIAYAVIAGMPPAMGLYAATIPPIVGGLMRSSRHVVAGPTNAVSLLVGGGVATLAGADPLTVGVTLALMVGLFQLFAGVLRLGAVVDYISHPVVLGYITGAGLLIAIGQLHNVTRTAGAKGDVVTRILTWAQGLAMTHPMSVAFALGTAALIVGLRWWRRRWPAALIAMIVATALSMAFDLKHHGLRLVHDLSPVPTGLPPLTLPDPALLGALLPLAIATTVLSLVESTAVARAIGARTGQRIDSDTEFTGAGLANITGAFFGAYPTSGSLSRSAMVERANAASRLAGVLSGAFMVLILIVMGDLLNNTPIAALAGLLLVVAFDLIDPRRLRRTLRSNRSDKLALVVTLLGTWMLPLDQAIYLGVGISLVLFLRQARLLFVQELIFDPPGPLREVEPDSTLPDDGSRGLRCPGLRILQLEGRLFFGVEGELRAALDTLAAQPEVSVIVIRLRRTQGMDITIASTLEDFAQRLEAQQRHLLLTGVRADTFSLLQNIGALNRLNPDKVFANQTRLFAAMHDGLTHALTLLPDDHTTKPLRDFLANPPNQHLRATHRDSEDALDPSPQ